MLSFLDGWIKILLHYSNSGATVLFKNILVPFNVSNKAHIKIHGNYSNNSIKIYRITWLNYKSRIQLTQTHKSFWIF